MSYAQDVRDALDKIDETPFGKVSKLLDRMADQAQRAVNEHKAMREVLDGIVLVCGRTGNAFEDFEEQAEVYHRETGHMRPGKDMSMASAGSDDDQEIRRTKYNAWVQSKIEAGRLILSEVAR
ncbi:hypothetical protein [Sphingomonas sp.]|uniref:hypothetical protein n=1 Tax=Sphingomonas sp. TaxID=28214 RepID=UPI0025E6F2FF|nr:hypothetical protein [Sphingomonas sp.]